MNRIYEGRVGAAAFPKLGKTKKDPVEWVPLGFTAEEFAKVKDERSRLQQVAPGENDDAADARKRLAVLNQAERSEWEKALREQHETFQDAVNYYFLALAAMAEGLKPAEEGARPREVKKLETELQERKAARKARKPKPTEEEKKAEEKRDKEIDEQVARLRREEAVWQWRNQVRDTWERVERGADRFDGPKKRLAKYLGPSLGAESFEEACRAVLKLSRATPEPRAEALMRLLELAGRTKGEAGAALTPLCTDKIVWLCSRPEDLDATDDVQKSVAEHAAWEFAKRIKDAKDDELESLAHDCKPADFTTRERGQILNGKEAIKVLLAYFKKVRNDSPELDGARPSLAAKIRALRRDKEALKQFEFRLPKVRVGLDYKVAKVFKILPSPVVAAVFRKKTEVSAKRKDVPVLDHDALADARTEKQPHFDYFSNLAFIAPAKPEKPATSKQKPVIDDEGDDDADENRAHWFEFDLVAFVEALKSPHRYYQDTQKRDDERVRLEQRRDKMKGEGQESKDGDDASEDTFGFKGDHRIDAIKELVREKDLLGYLEEEDDEPDPQYPINENTLRGWNKLRSAWREALAKPEFAKPDDLETELNRLRIEQQGDRPEEAGGGGLFKVLQREKYHCIWRDAPKGNQADDPLWAWVNFRELEEKIVSLSEPIRFTPAHATKSRRFFIFPKKPRKDGKSPKNSDRPERKSDHVPGMFARNDSGEIVPVKGDEAWLGDRPRFMALSAGVLVQTKEGLQPTPARIYYTAPRLRRDAIRRDGESGIGKAAMIQPMMEALGIAPSVPTVNFANCAVTLYAEPEDRPSKRKSDGEEGWRINLAFPVSVEPEELLKHPFFQHQTRWSYRPSGKGGEKNFAQFQYSAEEPRYEVALRWPVDEQHDVEAKKVNPGRATRKPLDRKWHEDNGGRFTCLPVDLGQRVGGAFALLDVRAGSDFGNNKKGKPVPSRFIGDTPGKRWYAAVAATGLLSLSGEDAEVFVRPPTPIGSDGRKGEKPKGAFQEEPWGDKGRPPLRLTDHGALRDETEEARGLLETLGQLDIMPPGWDERGNCPSTELSFPEQNDYLLKAVSRYLSRIRRLHRWCAFLKPNGKDKRAPEQRERALKEVREACGLDETGKPKVVEKTGQPVAGESWLALHVRALVENDACDEELQPRLAGLLGPMLDALPGQMETIANRCVPLRGRSWKWESLAPDEQGKPLHILRQSGGARPTTRMKMPEGTEREVTWIRGQRGFSSQRIEQIEILRRVLQSLNQIQRRTIGELVKRQKRGQDGGIPRLPDCCPDLLDKIAELKEQRVNQLAHQILAEALGVRLRREGPVKGDDARASSDIHGEYERIPCRLDPSGYRRPVDFIVIEDLKYYDTAVMRSRRENTRLMRWCRRHFRDKLKQLCEVFGIPVVETNPADTSKFCSRSGVAGFRAVEVGPGFEHDFVWNKALKKLEKHDAKLDPVEKAHCEAVRRLVQQVAEAQTIPKQDGTPSGKPRTLLAPLGSGNVFVPVVGALGGSVVPPAVVQADINAAINLGLRAIAEPTLWEIHPRLRTLRPKPEKPGDPAPQELSTREKRKYGGTSEKLNLNLEDTSAITESRQPHYYRDLAGIADWDTATVADPAKPGKEIELVSGKALWGAVKARQWKRVEAINAKRIVDWTGKLNPMP